MAYRNPLAWDRNLRPGLFVSDPDAQMPLPCAYAEEEEISPFEMSMRLQRDFDEIDRMNAELDTLYVQSLMPPIYRIS